MERDFIEPRSMDDQRLLHTHCVQGCRDPAKHPRVGDTEQLHPRPRRIDAGSEEIHDGPHFELPPDQRGMLHARVIGRREQEAEAGLVKQRPRLGRRHVDLRTDGLKDVGRAAARADAAVAMLGDRQAAGGGNECRRRRYVDQAGSIAARPATVSEQIIGALEWRCRGAQRPGRADHLLGRFALHAESDQHPGDLGGLEPSKHEPFEQMLGFLAREVAAGQQPGQGVGDGLRQVMAVGRGNSLGRQHAVALNRRNLVH